MLVQVSMILISEDGAHFA